MRLGGRGCTPSRVRLPRARLFVSLGMVTLNAEGNNSLSFSPSGKDTFEDSFLFDTIQVWLYLIQIIYFYYVQMKRILLFFFLELNKRQKRNKNCRFFRKKKVGLYTYLPFFRKRAIERESRINIEARQSKDNLTRPRHRSPVYWSVVATGRMRAPGQPLLQVVSHCALGRPKKVYTQGLWYARLLSAVSSSLRWIPFQVK